MNNEEEDDISDYLCMGEDYNHGTGQGENGGFL